MSSDSEDDCYGNIAQRLQSMKNNYREDKIETTNLLIADLKEKTDNSWRKNDSLTSEKDCDLSQNSGTAEELSLDAIIAKNSKKLATRSNKRTATVSADNILPEKSSRRKRVKKTDASTSQTENTAPSDLVNTTDANTSALDTLDSANSSIDASLLNGDTTIRGRGRGRGRGRQAAARRGRGRGRQPTIPDMIASNSSITNTRARARTRRRGRRIQPDLNYEPSMYDFMAAIAASLAMANGNTDPMDSAGSTGPIYSVGNTDEYPDQSDNQPLFSSIPKPQSDVIFVENDQELDDNEELSVKVYWQSTEHVKFNIRRFQNLTQIFNHFAERENVSHNKLFFTYNDKILKIDDTPDSINYNIAKFIDGGIVNQSVTSLVKKGTQEGGIKLKFQCQNVKKPFVSWVQPDEKMLSVMMKCAEHLEKPLDKLKFHFDGDLISGKSTARELELEGGECIDVAIIS